MAGRYQFSGSAAQIAFSASMMCRAAGDRPRSASGPPDQKRSCQTYRSLRRTLSSRASALTFHDGDIVELETEGLGRLRINVRDALKRTWSRETRLERQDKGLDPVAPQLTGKYAPA
jgi:hypothetical protein